MGDGSSMLMFRFKSSTAEYPNNRHALGLQEEMIPRLSIIPPVKGASEHGVNKD